MTFPKPALASRNEIFWEFTRSLCPTCKKLVDAQVLLRDNKVFLRKRCPEHGQSEALIFSDAQMYVDIARYNKPGSLPAEFATQVKRGCPTDCGLCPDHQQHSCLGIIEINNTCNLDCPVCFANSGTHPPKDGAAFELTYEQVESMLDSYVRFECNPEVLQFSGGEPTLHPQLLDLIALAKDKGIRHVMVNTNGIKIAHDDRLLEGLARLKPTIYLQFDGFEAETNRILRGKPDLLEHKLRALDRLAKADVRAVLVPAIERGVNEHEIGKIVEFGLGHPAVFGINFQCVFRAQRHIPADPLERITIPDIVRGIETQTNGLFTMQDFVPVPCCMPTCSFVTYAMLHDNNVIPIPRVVPVDTYLDYVKNRTVPGLSDDMLIALERLWSSSAQVGSDGATRDIAAVIGALPTTPESRTGERCPSCHVSLPLSQHPSPDLARHVFMLSIRDFMDPYTFSIKNAMKCCIGFLTTDGRMIPFCTYNTVGYRERAEAERLVKYRP
ncbi:MAG: radical SAM protein [Anaerolineales bacterium]